MHRALKKTYKCKCVIPGDDQAFTLIEVLVAMAIFAIGILAVAALILSTSRHNTNGNILTQATMLARAKIEEKKREADSVGLSNGTETETSIDTQGNPGGFYTRECDISTVGGTRQIQVTVSWTRQGRDRSVVMTTLN